ncbi:hypothetical protein GCM10010350_39270 [Streptomyces galilaeus]|nr:hypothetical protein GCM10010350_39270 [Streptomyces galilaeus]
MQFGRLDDISRDECPEPGPLHLADPFGDRTVGGGVDCLCHEVHSWSCGRASLQPDREEGRGRLRARVVPHLLCLTKYRRLSSWTL